MHTEFLFTSETYLDLQKRRIIFYSILGFFGIIGIILFAIFYPQTDYNRYLILLFIPSLVLAGAGIVYVIAILFMVHKLKDVEVRFVYEFYDELLKVKTYNMGEMTSNNEVHYRVIMKYKDTGKNFFLYLPNRKVLPLASDDPQMDKIKETIKIEEIPTKKI